MTRDAETASWLGGVLAWSESSDPLGDVDSILALAVVYEADTAGEDGRGEFDFGEVLVPEFGSTVMSDMPRGSEFV
jgi:hypothetical protein